jgi:S-adenosylmethionine decarboxylase
LNIILNNYNSRGMIANRYFSRESLGEDSAPKKGLGIHIILELYECDPQVVNQPQRIEEILLEAAKAANLKTLCIKTHKFTPYGVTSLLLISESHLSIHTWPEHNFAAADIFICGNQARKAADVIIQGLRPGRLEMLELVRGVNIQGQGGGEDRSSEGSFKAPI